MNSLGHHIRAMVVLPVQELATQIAKVFKKYCNKTGLKVALLSGATPLSQEQQQIVRYSKSSYFPCLNTGTKLSTYLKQILYHCYS